MVFEKFRELGSARQVLLWTVQAELQLPVMRQSLLGARIEWQRPGYHIVLQILQHPLYDGAYVFGRTSQRTTIVNGRAKKTALREKLTGPRFCWLSAKHRSWFGAQVQRAYTLGKAISIGVSKDSDLWKVARIRRRSMRSTDPAVRPW
jgi:hypothetical protein